MSITMPDGRTYTYLSDGLMVNGRRVTEARVDGALVYPRDEWPYWVRGTTTIDYRHVRETWKWSDEDGKYVILTRDACEYHVEASFSVSSRLPIRAWTKDRLVTNSDVQGGRVAYPMEWINYRPDSVPGVTQWDKVLRSSIDLRWIAKGFFGSVPERHMSAETVGLAELVPPREWGLNKGGFVSYSPEAGAHYLSFQLPGRISLYDSNASEMSFGFSGVAKYRFRNGYVPDGRPVYTRQDWVQECSIEHSPSPWATSEEYRAAWLAARDAL